MGLRNKMVFSVLVAPMLVTSLVPSTSGLPQNKSHEVLAQTLNKNEVLKFTEDVSKDSEVSSEELVKREVVKESPTTEELVKEITTTEEIVKEKTTSEEVVKDIPTTEEIVKDKPTIELPTIQKPIKKDVGIKVEGNKNTVGKNNVPLKKTEGANKVKQVMPSNNVNVFKDTLNNDIGVDTSELDVVEKSRDISTSVEDTQDSDIIEDKNGLKSSRDIIVKDRKMVEDDLDNTLDVIDEYKEKIESLKNNKEKLLAELDKLEEKIKVNKKLMDKVVKEQSEKSKDLLELKKKHELTIEKRNEKLKLFKERIVILQQNKTVDFSVLEGSKSFTDVKVKLEQFKNLSENDKAIIDELDAIIKTLDAQEEEIVERIDSLREDEKKLRKLETSMIEVRTKQNIVLESLNKKQIDLEMSLEERKLNLDGIKRSLSDLTESEQTVVEALSEGNTIEMSNKYQEYLDSVKKKREEVKEALVKDKERLAELESKKDLTDAEEKLAKTLRESIKKGTEFLSESKESGFIAPTKGIITSVIGYRNLFGYREFHSGVDIANALGTSIYSVEDGIVTYAGPINNGYGNVIVIDHYINGKVYSSLYGHMSAVGVKKGDKVKKGELIALMGSEGRSTGSHLHFEMYDKKKTDWSYNNLINPLDFIPRSAF